MSTINTTEALDALPIGTIVVDRPGRAWAHMARHDWAYANPGAPWPSHPIAPFTVLHIPGKSAPTDTINPEEGR